MNKFWTIISHYKHMEYVASAMFTAMNQKGISTNCLVINDEPGISLDGPMLRVPGSIILNDGVNKGQSARFNEGFEYAIKNDADWLSILGADDYISDIRFLILDEYIKAMPDVDVWCTGWAQDNGEDNWQYFPGEPFDAERIKKINFIAAGTVCVNRKYAEMVKYDEDVRYGEDWLWYNCLANAGARFGHIPIPTLYYRAFSSVIGMRTDENRAQIREKIRKVYEF